MDPITLGRTLGFSFAAGVNLYATVAILGLASRYGWVELPPQFQVFDNQVVIGAAIVMYVVEFFADKIPYLDSAWDLIHTLIRPVGGALIAVATLGDASPTLEGLVALLGGTGAAGATAGSHRRNGAGRLPRAPSKLLPPTRSPMSSVTLRPFTAPVSATIVSTPNG